MNKFLSWLSQIFLVPLLKIIFVKEVRGEENIPNRNFILASNHESHLDQLANGVICVPRRFYYIGQVDAYKGLEKFFRDFVYFLGGVIGLDRTSKESKKKVVQKSIDVLKDGGSLIIYPEGTRTRTGEMGKGKWGVAKLLFETGVPLLPVALDGTFELMPPKGKLKIKKRIKINIGKPLYFTEEIKKAQKLDKKSEEYKELLLKVTNQLMKKIKELKDEI